MAPEEPERNWTVGGTLAAAGAVPFGSGPERAARLILKVSFHNQSLQAAVFIHFSDFMGSL